MVTLPGTWGLALQHMHAASGTKEYEQSPQKLEEGVRIIELGEKVQE